MVVRSCAFQPKSPASPTLGRQTSSKENKAEASSNSGARAISILFDRESVVVVDSEGSVEMSPVKESKGAEWYF